MTPTSTPTDAPILFLAFSSGRARLRHGAQAVRIITSTPAPRPDSERDIIRVATSRGCLSIAGTCARAKDVALDLWLQRPA